VIKLKILDIFNSEDKDIKKIVSNKTSLEIVLLILKSNIEKKTLYADKFLELNTIKASRSKKINIIQDLEKSKILERCFDKNDKRKKIIKIRDEIKDKLNKFLD
jgi:hypothetical protein